MMLLVISLLFLTFLFFLLPSLLRLLRDLDLLRSFSLRPPDLERDLPDTFCFFLESVSRSSEESCLLFWSPPALSLLRLLSPSLLSSPESEDESLILGLAGFSAK